MDITERGQTAITADRVDRQFGVVVCSAIDYSSGWQRSSLLPLMPNFRSDDFFSRDLHEALTSGPRLRRLVRAAGNIRILLLGLPGRPGTRKATRPVATGTFSYPAFGTN
jgi:hypothetical protein